MSFILKIGHSASFAIPKLSDVETVMKILTEAELVEANNCFRVPARNQYHYSDDSLELSIQYFRGAPLSEAEYLEMKEKHKQELEIATKTSKEGNKEVLA